MSRNCTIKYIRETVWHAVHVPHYQLTIYEYIFPVAINYR